MKHSKRYVAVKEKIDREKFYDLAEAAEIIKQSATTKFDESIDVAFNLNLKAKHTIRDTITLPNPVTVDSKKVLVFAEGDAAEKAKSAGADYIGVDEYIKKIEDGWYDFDVAIATPDMMKKIGKLGKFLGRRGLMPNPKTGTVTDDVEKAVAEFKKGKEEYRANKQGIVHQRIAKASMSAGQIVQNANVFYRELLRKKPSDLKGRYIKSIVMSSSMGPGVKISQQSFTEK